MNYLDKEEKEIIESYDGGEWVSTRDNKKAEIEKAAKNSSKIINGSTFVSPKKIITIFR